MQSSSDRNLIQKSIFLSKSESNLFLKQDKPKFQSDFGRKKITSESDPNQINISSRSKTNQTNIEFALENNTINTKISKSENNKIISKMQLKKGMGSPSTTINKTTTNTTILKDNKEEADDDSKEPPRRAHKDDKFTTGGENKKSFKETDEDSKKVTNTQNTARSDKENKDHVFLSSKEADFLLNIPSCFLADQFNYMKLDTQFPRLKAIYEVINKNRESEDPAAEKMVYFQLHQRYIMTNKGTQKMFPLIYDKLFGSCITVECKKSPLIPFGRKRQSGTDVLVYCPNCNCFYKNKKVEFDGSAYGPDFAHLFNLSFNPNLVNLTLGKKSDINNNNIDYIANNNKTLIKKSSYVPKMFGFRIFNK
ncbi:Casein kinase II subunit beta' [Cucumispora dikerogammari]|nr:Casein kinase II subunit beta' [Cucumispora dikerogammari]